MQLVLRALPLALVLPAAAQTALLREGSPIPGGSSGQTVAAIDNTAVNQSGGYAATIRTEDAGVLTSQAWGALDGSAGTVLRSQGTFSMLDQGAYEGAFGISSGNVVYSANIIDPSTTAFVDSAWVDDTLIAINGLPIPGTANFIAFSARPGTTANGTPYFLGGRTSTVGGNSEGRVLFFGSGLNIVMQTGDVLPGLPGPLSTSGVDFDYRFSAQGTHLITEVDLNGSSAQDGVMTIDSAGLALGGTLVQEGQLIPTSVGGNGSENWDNFDFVGITESGDYMFTGDTSGAISTDEFIVRNGQIWAREGDVLDGETLTGAIEGAFLNEAGALAFIWDVVEGSANVEALYVDSTLVLKEGDEVDWDGDGNVDPGVVLTDFTGNNAITMGRNGTVYFTADVSVGGVILEGFFAMESDSVGTNYCMAVANSTGVPAVMSSTGSASAANNDLVISCTSMPINAFAFFVVSDTQGFVANPGGSSGNLCLGSVVGRAVGGVIANTGSAGTISANVDWTAVPQPSGTMAAMPGDTWNFQCWMRDTSPAGMATSNFSDGYSVVVE